MDFSLWRFISPACITALIVWMCANRDDDTTAPLARGILIFPLCLFLGLAGGQGREFEDWWREYVVPTVVAGLIILSIIGRIIAWREKGDSA
jgi:hypothetical protein